MVTAKPHFVRLEYYTATGWVMGHAGIALLDPAAYVKRLEDRGKFGRATELLEEDLINGGWRTGQVWAPSRLPKRTALVPTDTGIPGVPDPSRRGMCRHCDGYHGDPFDGSCLI